MPEHLRLAQLGESRRLGAAQSRRDGGDAVPDGRRDLLLDLRDDEAPLPLARHLEDDRLVPARLMEGTKGHRSTSSSSVASRSTSAFVWISVTQYRALWPSSGYSAERSLPPKMPRSRRAAFTSATVFPVPPKSTTSSLKNGPASAGARTRGISPRRFAAYCERCMIPCPSSASPFGPRRAR